jgi:predicted TPR repeat methyltransferase
MSHSTQDVAALLAEAIRLEQQGNLQPAAQHYQQVLAVQPQHPQALQRLGLLAFRVGQPAAAIQLVRQAIAADPNEISWYDQLAQMLHATGDLVGTAASYQAAIRRWPTSAEAYHNLSLVLGELARLDDAVSAARRAVELRPERVELQFNLGCALKNANRGPEAAEAFRRTLELAPDHIEAQFLLAAATGQTPPTAPNEYVARLFDDYATRFDSHLARLGYRVPERLSAAVRQVGVPKPRSWRVLDLGCGTGLCGQALRDVALHLAGVDLSPRMIELARRRGIYDELKVQDAAAALAETPQPLDLVVAGDVFIYIGELAAVFAAAARALRPGGLLAFSVELCDAGDFELRPSSRYAHSLAYISRLADEHGFALREASSVTLRRDREQDIAGQITVLSKRPR